MQTPNKHELHRFQGIVAPPFQGATLNILPARKIFGKVIPHPFHISLEGLGGGQGRQAIYLASSNEDLHAIRLDWQGIVRSVSEMYFFWQHKEAESCAMTYSFTVLAQKSRFLSWLWMRISLSEGYAGWCCWGPV